MTSITYKDGSTTIGNLTYSYDPDGRRSTVGGSLASVAIPRAVSGNLFNADNEMTNFNGYSLTYDSDGQTLTDTSNTYTWDTRRHLTKSYQTSLGSGYGTDFVYDALGRRVKVTDEAAGTTTQYLYDGLNPVALTTGSAVTNLLTGLSIDEYFSFSNSTGAASLLTDALGSTLALTDSTGAVFSTSTYEPFGRQPVGTIGLSASSPLITIPFEFTGREDDDGTNYYYRGRYYSTYLQRFLSQDPMDFAGGDTNLYGYVANQPTDLTDPFGLTFGTNIEFLLDFLTGGGQTNRSYGPRDVETQEMMRSPAVAAMRLQFQRGGCQNQVGISYGTVQAAEDTLLNPVLWSSTALEVGGFAGASVINNGNGTATFTIPNDAGAHSFLYHMVSNREGETGPMRTIQQTFQWTEPITAGGCGCH